MPASSSRSRMVASLTAAIIAVIVIGLVISSTVGGGSQASPAAKVPATSTTTAPPTADDINAAKACREFDIYLADAQNGDVPQAVGQALTQAVTPLLSGGNWGQLGQDLVLAAEDVINHDSSALGTDGAAAAQLCQTIPVNAQVAGGDVGDPGAPSTS